MNNRWRSRTVIMLVITVLAVAACGPAAQPDTSQPTAAPAAGSQATTAPAAGTEATAAPAAGGEATAAPVASTSGEIAAPTTFVEPPFLAERVKAGKLPPIEQRLPKPPFVVGPGVLLQEEYMKWENGEYGGDINLAWQDANGYVNIAGGSTILRSPSQTTAASRPNVVSEFSHSDDYTKYQFKIRPGLKWSDGEPVTTEDIRFTFEDLYLNPDVQRPWPSELYTQGNAQLGPAKLNVVDELTFELTFSQPYGFFIAALNSWIPNYDFLIKPAHYLKQFHTKYAKEADLAAALQKNNETDWVALLAKMDVPHWNTGEDRALGMPTLNAFILTEASETRRVFERNPYYWHVDSAGKQLPYADRIVTTIVVDENAVGNAILAGQVTIAAGNQVALNKMPVYAQNAEQAKQRSFLTGSFNWPVLLFLNRDFQYEDQNSAWQKLMSDPEQRFGKAIAAAINPADINKSIYFDLFGKPVMYEGAYDPNKANQLLDQAGMDKRDSKEHRLGPDGKEFIFRITNHNAAPDWTPVVELLKQQLEAVGIRVDIENVAGTLFDQRKTSNDIMAAVHWNDGSAWATGISEDYLPNHKGPWSPMTWQYFTTNGKQGRKPPADMEEFYKLHTERKKYPPESPEGQKVFQQLMQWMQDHYVMIPTAGARTTPNIVDIRLRNLPNEGAPFDLDTIIGTEGFWFAQQ